MGVPASGYTITPIVISNVMYLPVQGTIIVALKADAGNELWKFDLEDIAGIGPNPSAGGRGISYWPGTARSRAANRDLDRPTGSWCSSTRRPASRFPARRAS